MAGSDDVGKLPDGHVAGKPGPYIELLEPQYQQVRAMARIHCTAQEICDVLGMSPDTLDRRLKERGWANFSEFYARHQSEGKATLRRLQFKAAEDGNITAQIWLGKQILGQKDKTELSGDSEHPIALTAKLEDHREAVLEVLRQKHAAKSE